MKILYICHRFPFPPKRGGKIRPFNMIKHLSRDHEVTVASLVRSAGEAREAQGISPYCHQFYATRVRPAIQSLRMVARLPTLVPSSLGFFYSRSLATIVKHLLQSPSFDLIFVHCSSVARYVADVSWTPKILDFGDMDSHKWLDYARFKAPPLNLGFWLEGVKLRREEQRLARCFDICTTTTRAEWDTLQSYHCATDTDWFPNGVDTDYFSPDDGRYDPDLICFVGRMDYYPNQEAMFGFCADVLPLLRKHRPELRLQIIGADPPPAVRRLAQLPNVTVTGSVPDVRPYLRKSALMVAPLNIARGTQNKLLESMSAGVPVVTSSLAAAGVDAVPGEHMLVATSPEEYCAAILRVLNDPAERARLAQAGRARMQSHHNWAASMRKLDTIIERCLRMHKHPPLRARQEQEGLA